MKKTVLVLVLFLTACTASQAGTASPPAPGPATLIPVDTIAPQTSTAGTTGPCAEVFAGQGLPDLSMQVDKAIKVLQPEASASAYAIGENCVDSGGHATFAAMETDFKVNILVKDFDETALGTWIVKVMKVLAAFPPGVVPGPQHGRVEFEFAQGIKTEKFITVRIDKYNKLPPDMSPGAIYRTFSANP